jgi:hypothetical protein
MQCPLNLISYKRSRPPNASLCDVGVVYRVLPQGIKEWGRSNARSNRRIIDGVTLAIRDLGFLQLLHLDVEAGAAPAATSRQGIIDNLELATD